MSYFLYILYSPKRNKYYIGHTGDDLDERLRKHNSNHRGFTGDVGNWIIIYQEKYNTKVDAYKRERETKAWKSRKMIENLIGSAPPD